MILIILKVIFGTSNRGCYFYYFYLSLAKKKKKYSKEVKDGTPKNNMHKSNNTPFARKHKRKLVGLYLHEKRIQCISPWTYYLDLYITFMISRTFCSLL